MRGAFAAAICGGALFLAGCVLTGCGGGGGSSTTETSSAASTAAAGATTTTKVRSLSVYETKMQALGASLSQTLNEVGDTEVQSAQAKNVAALDGAALRKAQRALRGAAVKLDRLTPPAPIASSHRLLTKGVREYADELEGVIKQLKEGVAPRIALRSILALRGIKVMEQASAQIARKGYTISG